MQKKNFEPLRFISIGLELSIMVIAFTFAGYYVDSTKHTYPFGTVGGAILGMAGGFYILLKRLGMFNKK